MAVSFHSKSKKLYAGSLGFFAHMYQMTIEHLKGRIAEKTSIEPSHQKLIFRGKVLKDPDTLASYGMNIFLFSLIL